MEDIIIKKLTNIEKLLQGQDRPLTLEEAARYLDVSKSYLYKLTSTQKIPHFKPQGKRVYFLKSELASWLTRSPIKTEVEIEQEANDYLTNGRKRGAQ